MKRQKKPMIQKLQQRLTLLCSLLTSLILLITLLVAWHFSVRQYEANQKSLFSTSFHYIADHIASGSVLRDSWLMQQESANHCIIYIEDGTVPLYYTGDNASSEKRDALTASARSLTASGDNAALPFLFPLRNSFHDNYFGMYSVIMPQTPHTSSNSIQLWVLFDYTAAATHIFLLTALYTALLIFGSLALLAISHLLVRLAIKPTATVISQQNEFIAAASHELRSPLTVMKANLCALREALDQSDTSVTPDDTDMDALLSIAQKEADRMQHLTDDLLLLAGSDANAWSITLQPVQLETLLIEVYETFFSLAREQQHPLELLLPEEELPAIEADADRIKQLLGILLNNALVYSPPTSPVCLRASLTKNTVTLSVIDHGSGIPDAEKKLVFHRFYRCDKSRTDKSHFGLGLSVAREIAGAHNALLKVNDTPGGGATFSVCFLFHGWGN